MSLVRAAKGNAAVLVGPDITSAPADLIDAIDWATVIMSWQENLMDDEMPPLWMWHVDSALEDHFADVKRRREDRHRSPGRGDDGDEGGRMMSNALARDVR